MREGNIKKGGTSERVSYQTLQFTLKIADGKSVLELASPPLHSCKCDVGILRVLEGEKN